MLAATGPKPDRHEDRASQNVRSIVNKEPYKPHSPSKRQPAEELVELIGLEPTTSALQGRRSPS